MAFLLLVLVTASLDCLAVRHDRASTFLALLRSLYYSIFPGRLKYSSQKYAEFLTFFSHLFFRIFNMSMYGKEQLYGTEIFGKTAG